MGGGASDFSEAEPTAHVGVASGDGTNGTSAASSVPPPVDPHEYYRTYDVMTGVRIAATLGGFFGLMVLLVLYKSKSKTEKALEDPTFTAAAVAEVEEEERQIQLALEMTAYHQLNPRRSSRRSLDTAAYAANGACAATSRGRRHSSVAWRQPSPTAFKMPMAASLPRRVDEEDGTDEEDNEEEDDGGYSFYGDVYGYTSERLSVPRRSSNITCSSSGSSYLERRDSAVVLSAAPNLKYGWAPERRLSSPPAAATFVDWYYPIDIKVTQPTPGGSPSGSDRALHDKAMSKAGSHPRLAPLASISSCNSSLGTDYPECSSSNGRRHGTNSSSETIGGCADTSTDDEVDPFSTDSESDDSSSEACACKNLQRSSSRAPLKRELRVDGSQPSNSTSTLVEMPPVEGAPRRYSSPFARETLF